MEIADYCQMLIKIQRCSGSGATKKYPYWKEGDIALKVLFQKFFLEEETNYSCLPIDIARYADSELNVEVV